VSLSHKSSASQSTSTKSHAPAHSRTHAATPETTTSPAPAPSSATLTDAASDPIVTPAAGPAATPSSISSLAKKVIAQLGVLESMLGLDIAIRPNDKNQMNALKRVSDTAIALASNIVSGAPGDFPGFTGLPAAASYVESLGQVASRALELATHVQNGLQNQRAPAANQTLALYAVVKGLGRLPDNEAMREKVAALKAEVVKKPKDPKPKVTKSEKAVKRSAVASANRVKKALAVLAKEGQLPSAPAVAATPAPAPAVGATALSSPASAIAPATPPPTPASGAALATPAASH
jgi:hypothetical protein